MTLAVAFAGVVTFLAVILLICLLYIAGVFGR